MAAAISPEKVADLNGPKLMSDGELNLLLEEVDKNLPKEPEVQYSIFKNKIIFYSLNYSADVFDHVIKAHEEFKDIRKVEEMFSSVKYADAFINVLDNNISEDLCILFKYHNNSKDKIIWHHLHQLIYKDLVLVFEKSPLDVAGRSVRIAAPFELLGSEAESLGEYFPLNAETLARYYPKAMNFKNEIFNFKKIITTRKEADEIDKCMLFNRSALFQMDLLYEFRRGNYKIDGIAKVRRDFFTPAKRVQLVTSIVNKAKVYIEAKKKDYVMENLLYNEYYDGFFPLHDGVLMGPPEASMRAFLRTWAKGSFRWPMPIHAIRDYFGENVAFYFAFIDHYTRWTLYGSVLGFIAVIYGIFAAVENKRFFTFFDNEAIIFFALAITTWSLLFLKFWKRNVNYYSFVWDLEHFNADNFVRPQWKPTDVRSSEITGEVEEFEPLWRQSRRSALAIFGMSILISVLCLLFAATIAFEYYLRSIPDASQFGSVVASSSIALLQILILGPFGHAAAQALTNFENFKNEFIYMESLMFKETILSFTNYFGMLIYTAILKPIFTAVGATVSIFGYTPDQCVDETNGISSCMVSLVLTVTIVFALKQFLVQASEIILPFVKMSLERKQKVKKLKEALSDEMKELSLQNVSQIDFFSEYDTKMMQFGYVVMFSAAFPIAPFLAWTNNLIEMRSDLFKYLAYYKRLFAKQARGIGTWDKIIKSIIRFGIFTNAVIVSFTSRGFYAVFFQHLTVDASDPKIRIAVQLGFIIIFEHILSLIEFAIDTLIPDVPTKVIRGREGEAYIEKLRYEEFQAKFKESEKRF